MSAPELSAERLMQWLEKTSVEWRALIEAHPELLAQPCDIAGTHTMGELLQHIVAVELRYAERLAGQPVSDYADVPFDSAASIYATHERAMGLVRQQLRADVDWNERLEFKTRAMGTVQSSRHTVLFHLMLHGIRHYAQLATLARHAGVKPDWPMDYFAMDYFAMDMERV
jgi:uncharacterized damage-inducible protein DinB